MEEAQWTLVGVTIVYVFLTGWLAMRASQSAQASKRAADAAERSVLAAVMPLVLAVRGSRHATRDQGIRQDVQVTNYGSAAAFNVEIRGPSERRLGSWSVLEAGGSTKAVVSDPEASDLRTRWDQGEPIVVSYVDGLGNGYQTRTNVSNDEEGRFREVRSYLRRGDTWEPLAGGHAPNE